MRMGKARGEMLRVFVHEKLNAFVQRLRDCVRRACTIGETRSCSCRGASPPPRATPSDSPHVDLRGNKVSS